MRIIPKKLQIKVFRPRISYKKVCKGIRLSPPGVELAGSKDDTAAILNYTETENCIHFWAERCQKYALFQRKLQIKNFWHSISDKKVCEGMCRSPPIVELGGSKDGYG